MIGGQNLLFLFSSLGVLNALLLSFYFFYKSKPGQSQNKFLAALLFVLSLRIGKSVIFFFFDESPHLWIYLQVGLSACFLIGPFLFFYVYHFFNEKRLKHWSLQILFFITLISFINFKYPFLENRDVWGKYFLSFIYWQWFAYMLITLVYIWKKLREMGEQDRRFLNKKYWIISVWLGVFLIWLAYMLCGITSYMLGAVSFTFMAYLLFFLLLSGFNHSSVLEPEIMKYGGNSISKTEAEEIYLKLEAGLGENFHNPSLKIGDLSQSIGVPKHLISQVLNEHYQGNFSSVLRKYRIEKVKKMMKENGIYTLEAIGQECGFKAKSSFYAAFKKETGMTPLQFKKQLLPEKGSDL